MTQLATFPLLGIGPNKGAPNAPGYQYGYRITSTFGLRPDPLTGRPGTMHGGEDLGAGRSTPMLAVLPGWFSPNWDSGGGGNWSNLTCDDGSYFGYGHALGYNGGARRVRAGEVIAYVDSTGASTGDHLHFAYKPPGVSTYRDPYDLLQEVATRLVNGGGGAPVPPPPGDDDMYTDADRTIAQQTYDAVHYAGMGVGAEVAQFENDTRLVILNGVQMITAASDAEMADRLTQAGWASRPYAFCYYGHPEVFQWIDTPGGQARQWIGDQGLLADLVRTKLNPAVQVFPPDRKPVHDHQFPIVGTQPPGYVPGAP